MIAFCTEEPGAGRKSFEFEGWGGKEMNLRPVFSELIEKTVLVGSFSSCSSSM